MAFELNAPFLVEIRQKKEKDSGTNEVIKTDLRLDPTFHFNIG